MIEPYQGVIYDPACGSGGNVRQFYHVHRKVNHGNKKEVLFNGQSTTATTYKLAKMNLAIRGMPCQLGWCTCGITLIKDQQSWFWTAGSSIMANIHLTKRPGVLQLNWWLNSRWRGYESRQQAMPITGGILRHGEQTSRKRCAWIYFGQWRPPSGGGEKYKIRRKSCQKTGWWSDFCDSTRSMFYTTDYKCDTFGLFKTITRQARTVTLPEETRPIIAKRKGRSTFWELRQLAKPFEKKIQLSFLQTIFRITCQDIPQLQKFFDAFDKRSLKYSILLPRWKLKQRFLISA